MKVFRTDAPYDCIMPFIKHYMNLTRFPLLAIYSYNGPLIKVCDWGTFFQLKVYKRGALPVKIGEQKGPYSRVSLYKSLKSNLSPREFIEKNAKISVIRDV